MPGPMGGPGRGPKGGRPGKASLKDINKDTLLRVLKMFGPYKFQMIIVVLFIALSAVVQVLGARFLQTLIDDYITPMVAGVGGVTFADLGGAVLKMACVFLSGMVFNFTYQFIMASVSQGILKKVRDQMFDHMQTLPIRYFDQSGFGNVMSYYTNDTDSLRQMISQSIPQTVNSIMSVISVFVTMISISCWLTICMLLVLVVVIFVVGKIGGKSGKYFSLQQKSIADVNSYIEEMVGGQKNVKVFCHEEKNEKDFDEKNEELFQNMSKANTYANILGPIMNNLGHIVYVAIAIIGGILAIKAVPNLTITGFGVLKLGGVASFLTLSRNFIQPISNVSQQINSIVFALAGAQRIFSLIDEPSEVDNGYVTLVNARVDENGEITETDERTGVWAWKHPHEDGTLTYTRLTGNVVFDDVDFSYNPEKQILHNIKLYAEPGQKVAFVGATGAGKTTITNLINRFYDIEDGKIRYDGININKIKKHDLRRSLGIVLQDVNLFTGTVMENIRYGRIDATDEECINAAKLANADGFIRMLPHGYDTVLKGDGSGLSQGQRQLVSIARAAVADPPVMILDEATSSIDTRTEALVQSGMDSLMKGRTVFVIAHRLSTVRNADVIMVLENGVIIERGNHDSLIEQRGKYYQLYTGAFELE